MPFSDEVLARLDADADQIIAKYPRPRSALLPLLHLVQSEEGYVSADGIAYCAAKFGLAEAEVTAVVSFYTMFNMKPLGRFNHVGHNIGLETEERWLDEDGEAAVRAGMVINIELYTTAASGEQVGDEETYIIEGAGPSRISTLPRKIHEID